MKFNFVRLFKILPPALKISWGLLLIGFLVLVAACFTGPNWQSFAGTGCLLAGYIVVIIDSINPKRPRSTAVRGGFYGGIMGATLTALIGAIVCALFLAVLFGVTSLMDRTVPLTLIQALHFIGVLFAYFVVSGVPKIALKAKNETETEPGGNEQPATRP